MKFDLRKFRNLTVAITLATLTSGCLMSGKPLFDSTTRVVPFASGSRFEVFQRDRIDKPWKKRERLVVVDANRAKLVKARGLFRELEGFYVYPGKEDPSNPNGFGLTESKDGYSIHAISQDTFVIVDEMPIKKGVGYEFGAGRYSYALLEIHGQEALVTVLFCDDLDAESFKRAGGEVGEGAKIGAVCRLDGVKDPKSFFLGLKGKTAPQLRLVAVANH